MADSMTREDIYMYMSGGAEQLSLIENLTNTRLFSPPKSTQCVRVYKPQYVHVCKGAWPTTKHPGKRLDLDKEAKINIKNTIHISPHHMPHCWTLYIRVLGLLVITVSSRHSCWLQVTKCFGGMNTYMYCLYMYMYIWCYWGRSLVLHVFKYICSIPMHIPFTSVLIRYSTHKWNYLQCIFQFTNLTY